MKVNVTEKNVLITEISQVNQGEYGVNQCQFILPKCFDGLSVMAVFGGIPVPIVDSNCFIPALAKGDYALGVYAYRENEGETELVYSPRPDTFCVGEGSFTNDFIDEKIPGISEFDLLCERLGERWKEIIESNTLTEYTADATENQYYSAKVLNEMYLNLVGHIEEISALVGGAQ